MRDLPSVHAKGESDFEEGVPLSQQEQVGPAPSARETESPPSPPAAPAAAPAPAPQSPPSASHPSWGRLAIPLFAVLAAFGFIALATLRWDAWVGSEAIKSTNDAYVRAELTRLSSRVAGEVLTVAANDFQRVKAGDLLVQIDPADYQAQVAQAEAGVIGAQAALDNLANQVELQYATIAQGEAQQLSAHPHHLRAAPRGRLKGQRKGAPNAAGKAGPPCRGARRQFPKRETARPRRANCARQRLAIRTAAARQRHGQFHQGGPAHPGPDRVRQMPALAGSPAAGNAGCHTNSPRRTAAASPRTRATPATPGRRRGRAAPPRPNRCSRSPC